MRVNLIITSDGSNNKLHIFALHEILVLGLIHLNFTMVHKHIALFIRFTIVYGNKTITGLIVKPLDASTRH